MGYGPEMFMDARCNHVSEKPDGKKLCYRNQFVSSCRSCPFLSLAHGGSVKAPVCNCFPEQLYSAYRRDRIIACIPRKNSTASTPYWYRAWHSACSIKPLFPRCVERITL